MDILKRKDSVPNTDEISQKHKYVARFASAFAGIICIVLGLWVAFTFKAKCVVAGLYLALAGSFVITLETPILFCMKVSLIEKMITFFDSKSYWIKTILYFCLALPPILICPRISTVGASLFIFVAAALYGSLALGKKAKREEMIAKMMPKMTNSGPLQPNNPPTVTLYPTV